MGVLESVAAIATAVAAAIALGIKLWRDAKARKAAEYAAAEALLSERQRAATTDEERKKIAKELYDLRHPS